MPGNLWTDRELQIAVETYLYALRLQQAGIDFPENDISKFLAGGPLQDRNNASIRYRMRNISSVLRGRGWPILAAYSPANQVGSGVRQRIEAILDAHPRGSLSFLDRPREVVSKTVNEQSLSRQEAESHIQVLDDALASLEGEFATIGHNNPPEPIDSGAPTARAIVRIREELQTLKEELSNPTPNISLVEHKKRSILSFGLKLAGWLAERLTKFTDAALITLAPVVVVKVTNTLPLIVSAISSVTRYLQHLPN